MNTLIIGASRGLGRAFVEGLGNSGDTIVGVSRHRPEHISPGQGIALRWIEADLSDPLSAVDKIAREAPEALDVIIYNVGIWEPRAFEEDYAFLNDEDDTILDMVNVNIAGPLLLLKRLLPRLWASTKPSVILTGSTSGLPQGGGPEVTFGASKFALTGIADALREGFRDKRLAVTCLQLGYLNTDDPLSVPVEVAAQREAGVAIPVHDVVHMTRAILSLSASSFVKEITLPAILADRF